MLLPRTLPSGHLCQRSVWGQLHCPSREPRLSQPPSRSPLTPSPAEPPAPPPPHPSQPPLPLPPNPPAQLSPPCIPPTSQSALLLLSGRVSCLGGRFSGEWLGRGCPLDRRWMPRICGSEGASPPGNSTRRGGARRPGAGQGRPLPVLSSLAGGREPPAVETVPSDSAAPPGPCPARHGKSRRPGVPASPPPPAAAWHPTRTQLPLHFPPRPGNEMQPPCPPSRLSTPTPGTRTVTD